ncbi:MAG: hypothetical protein KDM91_19955 [Verrucomicrobiae bacterium]|nr:hypothetical protein [Verrucomicrobiae bacterium]MCP5541943.1 hypothetical protein [Akkermansiaceae bacterium]MCP5550189.1 hypothetical protein [Akkermansiaceae bacterium]
MEATLTIDEAGRINLPESARRVFGAEVGCTVRAEINRDHIEIFRDAFEASDTMRSPVGRLVLAPSGMAMDSASAVRAERDAMEGRGLRR